MTYKVKYSKVAIRDMDRMWAEVYEASKRPDTANRYIEDFLKKVGEKKDFPQSGTPLYYEDGFTGYYYVVFKAYIAFYRVEGDSMLVDRVLFGKSDYMRTLRFAVED